MVSLHLGSVSQRKEKNCKVEKSVFEDLEARGSHSVTDMWSVCIHLSQRPFSRKLHARTR